MFSRASDGMQQRDQNTSADNASSAVAAPAISLPKGGGAIRSIGEKFAANPVTGTGSLTVPIPLSPGRAGFGPQLTLTYDSGSGNGAFGFGWGLGLPAITRKTDNGLPQYRDADESDVYILSGTEDLTPVLQPDGTRPPPDASRPGFVIQLYRPRIEGLFAHLERWENTTTGEVHWRSISKDNVSTLYGRTAESRIADPAAPTRVFAWLICQSYDDKGNAVVYRYAAEDDANVDVYRASERHRERAANRYLKRIQYGNRTPNRDLGTWQPLDPGTLPADTWMFEAVLDYGEGHYTEAAPDGDGRVLVHAQIAAPAQPGWSARLDPFSTYRPGFEVRTHRLCRRVLMFHHFPHELGRADYLVSATEFDYTENLSATFLTSVTQSGYVLRSGKYLKKALPPLEFEYSQAPTPEQLAHLPVREVDPESLENLPIGLDGTDYQWLDLDGEGLSGLLTEQTQGWFYKRNLSANHPAATFGPLERVTRKPASGQAGGARFFDLAGDGRQSLVQTAGPERGYYERTPDADWTPFRAFTAWPNVDSRSPNARFIDLTGDGHADLLITDGEALTWYLSLAEQGFGPSVRVDLPPDEEQGPRLVFGDGAQSVYLADLSGDGLSDIVRIRNGEVCYWPNLGYGRFGAKVTMDNAPWFDAADQFDQRRLRLADVDGSGTTDLLYLRSDGVRLFANQSGNTWSDPVTLPPFPGLDNLAAVQAVDLLGNDTACLVWSSPLPGAARRPMRYVALMDEKPHLLTRVKNNLGAETRIRYAPSTRFYLDDRQAGNPWITRLPFPVHVVDRVETDDHIGRRRFITRYAYHHGYYDGVEREFRGFGLVEQWDTEEPDSAAPLDAPNWDTASFVPPVLTRTWFHTGAYLEGVRISGQWEREYYREGDASRGEAGLTDVQLEAMRLPDTVLPVTLRLPDGTRQPYTLTGAEAREACRALKGALLRQEVYGLDHSDLADRPYRVSERNYTVELLQRCGQDRHAVFFTHARETVDYAYERRLFTVANGNLVDPNAPPPAARDLADPRVTHTLALAVDVYGNVLQSVSIAYGRRFRDPALSADGQQRQMSALVTCAENTYTPAVSVPDAYRTPLPAEARTYEIVHLALNPAVLAPDITNLFPFDEVARQIARAGDGAHDLPYEDVNHALAVTPAPYRRLIERTGTLYRADDLSGLLPLGAAQSLALPGESYRLALTPGLVQALYVTPGKLAPAEVDAVLGIKGGYVHFAGDLNWWVPSGRVFYSPAPNDPPAVELTFARAHFFLPHRFRDAFGSDTTVAYDGNAVDPARNHNLLLVETRDPLGNLTTVNTQADDGGVDIRNDYRVLQPAWVTDPNGNRTQAVFDALGRGVANVVMGKPGENQGDTALNLEPEPAQAQIDAYHDALDPRTLAPALLQGATQRVVYDAWRFYRSQQAHPADPTQWEPAFVATLARETHAADPLPPPGLKLQLSFSYSDGFGREIQKKIQAEPGRAEVEDALGQITVVDTLPNPRWVGSGWVIYNNKGKPVREYEPFFSVDHQFQYGQKVGVSPVLFYDPAGRVVATLRPNHTWEKVVFDPWRQATWDVADTILIADPKTDPDVGDFFSRQSDADYLPTWYSQRQGGALGAEEQDAARKAGLDAATPTVVHADALGRSFLKVAHNKFKYSDSPPADPPLEEFYGTQTTLDIEGNQREIVDALGRVVMCYDYDVLSHRVHQASMEAGERWMLNDVAGKPIRAWDSRSHLWITTYDELRRPTEFSLRVGGGAAALVGRTVYGEARPTPEAANLRGKVAQVFDQAGVVTHLEYDFKGNRLRSQRQLAQAYKDTLDWSQAPTLENPVYITATTFDALNRPASVTTPDASVIRPLYNEAKLLEQLDVNLRGAQVATPFVLDVDYDAKGQRQCIAYAGGATTTYAYDPATFRLTRLQTSRAVDAAGLQDLNYTYDPAGNMTRLRDAAQQTLYFRNKRVEPSGDFTYDAVYRLIEATGREHLGQAGGAPVPHSYNDAPRVGLLHPNDGNALGTYWERYAYDAVGNFQEMRHRGSDPANPGWTRTYTYQEPSLLEPAKHNNRLSSTTVGGNNPSSEPYAYDAQGNLLQMPQLQVIEWDFMDWLHLTQRQAVNNTDADGALHQGERTYYVYDASGQRTRKVTERATGARKSERIYLGAFEIYREFDGQGNVTLERETLHVLDDKQRIALVETRTQGQDPAPQQLIRYQFGNHLGSASLELDDQAQIISYEEYAPYGSTTYSAGRSQTETPKRFRYTGKERDEESGLYYHGARYYAPWLARWTACDPLGLADGVNVYQYVHSQPLRLADPTGTQGDTSDEPSVHFEHVPVDPSGPPRPGLRLVPDRPRFSRLHLQLEAATSTPPAPTTGSSSAAASSSTPPEPPGDPQPATATTGFYQGAAGQDPGNVGVTMGFQRVGVGSGSTALSYGLAAGLWQFGPAGANWGGLEAVGGLTLQGDSTGTVTGANLGPVGLHLFWGPDSSRVNVAGYLLVTPDVIGQSPTGAAGRNPLIGGTFALEGLLGGPSRNQPFVVLGFNAAYGYQRFSQISAAGAPDPQPSTSLRDTSTITGTLNAAFNFSYYESAPGVLSKTPRFTLFAEGSGGYTLGSPYSSGADPGTPGGTGYLAGGGGALYNVRLSEGAAIFTLGAYGGVRAQWDTVGPTTFPALGAYGGGFAGVSWR